MKAGTPQLFSCI